MVRIWVPAIWVPASACFARDRLEPGAKHLGVRRRPCQRRQSGGAMKLKPVRIGLYDQYGGSMPSGWTRWLFEQYEFPFESVYPQTLDAGNLKSKFDVLVFTGRRLARLGAVTGRVTGGAGARSAEIIPDEYRGWLGGSRRTRPCRSSRSSWRPAGRL